MTNKIRRDGTVVTDESGITPRAQARGMFASGKSVQEIAEFMGASTEYVEKLLPPKAKPKVIYQTCKGMRQRP
jgi:DNA-binding CsgD family transcriptional regulator